MTDLPAVDLTALYGRLDSIGEAARELRDSLNEETESRVAEQTLLARKQLTAERAIDESKRASRRAWRGCLLGVAALVLVVAVFSVLWNRRLADQTNAAVVNCQNANVSRKAIIDEFSSFIDVLVAVSPPATTAEVAQARKQTIDKLRTDFAAATPTALLPRDCSVKAVTSPTTLATTKPSTLAPGQ